MVPGQLETPGAPELPATSQPSLMCSQALRKALWSQSAQVPHVALFQRKRKKPSCMNATGPHLPSEGGVLAGSALRCGCTDVRIDFICTRALCVALC